MKSEELISQAARIDRGHALQHQIGRAIVVRQSVEKSRVFQITHGFNDIGGRIQYSEDGPYTPIGYQFSASAIVVSELMSEIKLKLLAICDAEIAALRKEFDEL